MQSRLEYENFLFNFVCVPSGFLVEPANWSISFRSHLYSFVQIISLRRVNWIFTKSEIFFFFFSRSCFYFNPITFSTLELHRFFSSFFRSFDLPQFYLIGCTHLNLQAFLDSPDFLKINPFGLVWNNCLLPVMVSKNSLLNYQNSLLRYLQGGLFIYFYLSSFIQFRFFFAEFC